MTQDNKYHVIGAAFSDPWVLNLEPRTFGQCKRDIAWQRRGLGQFDPPEYWQITEYEPSQGFVNADGQSFIPTQSPYTDAAWADFWAMYEDAA